MFTPKAKRTIGEILYFSAFLGVAGIVYEVVEFGLIGTLNHHPTTGTPYIPEVSLIVVTSVSMIVGAMLGTLEVLVLSKLFKKSPFSVMVLVKSLIYSGFTTFALISYAAFSSSIILDKSLLSSEVQNNVANFLGTIHFQSALFYAACSITMCILIYEISSSLGQGVIRRLLLGKYHKPREEERIFLFVDMKSSTRIAEKLGHIQYFKLLKEYYFDMSPAILRSKGEVYQYVGDEIIISWPIERGVATNDCIKCYFRILESMIRQKEKYLNAYGHFPEFKAGMHLGSVTTGEIGDLKKEILFTGDVLNTTARIQSLCNENNVSFLFTQSLLDKLSPHNFNIMKLGDTELRGKDKSVKLYTVN
jgi:adenylate cyclase